MTFITFWNALHDAEAADAREAAVPERADFDSEVGGDAPDASTEATD